MLYESSSSNGCVGSFNYLNSPITSVEWSPHDNSVLAVSSDQQLTIWDLSLEADAADQIPDVPPQLLFVHAVSYILLFSHRVKMPLKNYTSILRFVIWLYQLLRMGLIASFLILLSVMVWIQSSLLFECLLINKRKLWC